jgi:catechol 2,3-dioxygenase-like lactoylglutathione lyase family enzyme
MNISRVFHVNINCSDLARSKAFYEELVGLRAGTHTLPEPQPVESFRIPMGQWDAYMLDDGSPGAPVKLDLLEWKQPRPVGKPYPAFNHLGFFRLCFLARDLDAKYAQLMAAGVECFSPPTTLRLGDEPNRTVRFFCAPDPDGTAIEFVAGNSDRLSHLNVNCSDLERSRAFYEDLFGYPPSSRSISPPQSGAAFGYAGEVAWDAYFFTEDHADHRFILDLLEWKQPRPVGRPYAEANHLGIFRLAMLVPDIEAAYVELQSKGIPCWSPPEALAMGPGLPTVKALLFSDPDGTTLELIESPRRRAG